ncbi:MAG: hypothetical protein COA38_15655 [Fluviicola sp.]|nr:MAG: hypothetical protein COA38_15655 [Fluviicola sp.]
MTTNVTKPSFGDLEGLIGTWKGVKGWSLISVPAHGGTKDSPNFRLIVQNYTEVLTFKAVDTPVENDAGDVSQFIGAIEYEQVIHDFDTKELIHIENGMFMYLNDIKTASGEAVSASFPIARSGTIPHGNSILVMGIIDKKDKAPVFKEISSMPSAVDQDGAPLGFFDQFDDEQKRLTATDIVIKQDSLIFNVKNPNDNLVRDNKGLKFIDTIHMSLDSKNEGTVGNIPFLQKHAKATDVFSDFWLSTVKLPMSEKPYQQLQYSQNVGISFHEKFNGKQGLINWPHITINTLTKID